MAVTSEMKLSVKQKADLAELIDWLRKCPSRHRHLLFMLESDLYSDLNTIEWSSSALAERVEFLLGKHS